MAVIISDDFTGVTEATDITGRTLNNGLGGSLSINWQSPGTVLEGAGTTAVDGSANANARAVIDIGGNSWIKHRILVDPNSNVNGACLYAFRTDAADSTSGNHILISLGSSQTSLRVNEGSSQAVPNGTQRAATTITAPGTTFWLEMEVDGLTIYGRVLNSDLSVRNTVSHTFSSLPSGTIMGFGNTGSGANNIYDNYVVEDASGGGDTTAPTLTSATGTATGSTTATVSVSSTEAGPGWAVLTPTSTQPSQAQVEAGQDHTGSTTGVFLDTATLAIGANPAAFAFTGLTPGATYWPHVVAKDTATPTANVSAVESGPSFTMPAPDVIDPAFAGGTTLNAGTKTNSSIALSTSAVATDNIAVTGYEWSSDNGATYPFTSLTNSFTFTALADLTSYNFRVRAYDGAGNRSAHLALTSSTYRAGDTAANVIANTAATGGNPAGHLYALALTQSPDAWLSYRTISGPTPSDGILFEYVDGRYTYNGPSQAVWTVQPEINGADHTDTTVINLYDVTGGTLKTWNGSAWVVKPLKYWTGTEWLTKPLKRWNGTAWV